MSDVTVLIPTFNRAVYLQQSIESILRQTIAPCQIIVVDDGSTDGTEEIIAPYRNRIEYLLQDNRGKPAALNVALPRVQGNYIWVFDDDDVACEDAIERHLHALARRPEAGFSYGGYYAWKGDPESRESDLIASRPPRRFPDNEHFIENLLSCYLPSPAAMVRADIQRAAGPYREDLLRGEDFEMSIRWGLLAPPVRITDAQRPTYYQRQHTGVRGPIGHQYSSSHIRRQNRDDSRKALRGLSQAIELRHYLPCDCWERTLDERVTARAMVRRWAVHMQNGMWPEALDDLAVLSTQPLVRLDIADDVTKFGMRSIFDLYMLNELVTDGAVMHSIRELLYQPNLYGIRTAIARQLYYRIAVGVRERDSPNLALYLKVAVGVLGLVGFPASLLRHKLRQRALVRLFA